MSDERINGWWTPAEALRRNPQLVGATLVWRAYSWPSPDWDHDHCALCWTKIVATASDDVLDAVYTDDVPTITPSPTHRGISVGTDWHPHVGMSVVC